MTRTSILGFALIFSVFCATAADRHWPAVRKVHFVFHFSQGKDDTFSATIDSLQGKPLYRFECADAEGSKRLGTASDVWSGDLECHLLSVNPEHPAYQSLLVSASDPSVSAGRGVFLAYMLKNKCATYPDWGLVRQFRLRGMKVILSLSDVVYEPYSKQAYYEGIKAATLTIDVLPDPTATSSLALPSRYAPPKVLNPDDPDQNKYRVDCTQVHLESR